jgi:hypothetical protein
MRAGAATSPMMMRRPSSARLVLLLCALPGPVWLVNAVRRTHLMLFSDSITYVAAARNLAAGGEYLNVAGDPLAVFPPFLPAMLLLGGLIGIEFDVTGLIINATAWVALAFIAGLWAMEVSGKALLGASAALAISLASPIYAMMRFLQSEPLFSALVFASLYFLWKFVAAPTWRWLFLAASCCAAASLTRYAGLFVFAAEAAMIAALWPETIRRRAAFLSFFAVCALSPIALWFLRNYLIMGATTGARFESGQDPAAVGHLLTGVIGLWWLPQRIPEPLREYIGAGILVTLGIVALICLPRAARPRRGAILLLAGSSVVYFAAMLWASLTANACCFGGRFEAPFFAPMAMAIALSAFVLIDRFARSRAPRLAQLTATGVAALIFLTSIALSLPRIAAAIEEAAEAADFGAPRWSKSAAIAYVKELEEDVGVFSNVPYPVFLYGKKKVLTTPSHGVFGSNAYLEGTPHFKQNLTRRPKNVVVWFHMNRDYINAVRLYDIADWSHTVPVSLIKSFPDADVYLVDTVDTVDPARHGASVED